MRNARFAIRFAAASLGASVLIAAPAAAIVGSDERPALPLLKQAMLEASNTARQDAPREPAPPKDPLAAAPARAAEPAWVTGIIQSGQAPFPGSVFRFENQWHEIVGGEHVNVYAGALRNDPRQGIVAVEFNALDITGPASTGGVYPTPARRGAVRIVAASPVALTLVAEDGSRFTFDLATRTFALS